MHKVISAYSHNQGSRVTLLYQGLGSFTFELVGFKSEAVLVFQIIEKDVSYLEIKGESFIQAKCQALGEEDESGNGKGVTETSAILYNISSALNMKQKMAIAPKERINFRFYLNESFLRT